MFIKKKRKKDFEGKEVNTGSGAKANTKPTLNLTFDKTKFSEICRETYRLHHNLYTLTHTHTIFIIYLLFLT